MTPLRFAARVNWSLKTNPLAALLEKKRKRGDEVLDLTESNPTECGFRYLKPSLLTVFSNKKNLTYAPDAHGLLEAREAVSRYYADKKIVVDPQQIFLTASTSEAYSFLFRLLLDPNDRVLAPRPSYPLLDYLADLNDVKLDFYPLRYQNRWGMDLDVLEEKFQKKPKAIIVVNPNNPTGNFVTEEEAAKMIHLCRKHESAIISDEVFLDFLSSSSEAPKEPSREGSGWFSTRPFGARSNKKNEKNGDMQNILHVPIFPPKSFAGNTETLTFTLSGISKILGLPQMKLSWIVVSGPQKLRKLAIEKLEVIADTYLSVNTPSQRALPAWLRRRQPILSEIRERVIANRHLLGGMFNIQHDPTSQGGWYAVLPLKIGLSDDAAAMRLLDREDVLVHPGYFYNFQEGDFLVVSLLPRKNLFKEGIRRIVHCDILKYKS